MIEVDGISIYYSVILIDSQEFHHSLKYIIKKKELKRSLNYNNDYAQDIFGRNILSSTYYYSPLLSLPYIYQKRKICL